MYEVATKIQAPWRLVVLFGFIFLYFNTNSLAWHIADTPEIGIEWRRKTLIIHSDKGLEVIDYNGEGRL